MSSNESSKGMHFSKDAKLGFLLAGLALFVDANQRWSVDLRGYDRKLARVRNGIRMVLTRIRTISHGKGAFYIGGVVCACMAVSALFMPQIMHLEDGHAFRQPG